MDLDAAGIMPWAISMAEGRGEQTDGELLGELFGLNDEGGRGGANGGGRGGVGPEEQQQGGGGAIDEQMMGTSDGRQGDGPQSRIAGFEPKLEDDVFMQAWARDNNGELLGSSAGGRALMKGEILGGAAGEQYQHTSDLQGSGSGGGSSAGSGGGGRKTPMYYHEKELREAAAAEVAETKAKEKEGGGGGGSTSCGSSDGGGGGPGGGSGGGGRTSRKRNTLTAEERAAQSRFRNREHARNTRLRKKAYMKKLKELVDDLERQRKEESRSKEVQACRVTEEVCLRKKVVQTFLHLRATDERERAKWALALNEECTLTLPITPYRFFHRAEVSNNLRVIQGIDAIMADASSLRLIVEAVGYSGAKVSRRIIPTESVVIHYIINEDDMMMSHDTLMCRWVMQTENAVLSGALCDIVTEGMLYCRFSPNDKLTSIELIFDVMTVMQQLQRASGVSCDSLIVPNSLDAAFQRSSCARVLVKAHPPYPILHVNEQWTLLRGHKQVDVEGHALDLLQGDGSTLLLGDVMRCRPASGIMMIVRTDPQTYTRTQFLGYFQLFPLHAPGTGGGVALPGAPPHPPTHILGILREVPSAYSTPSAGANSNSGGQGQGMQQHQAQQQQKQAQQAVIQQQQHQLQQQQQQIQQQRQHHHQQQQHKLHLRQQQPMNIGGPEGGGIPPQQQKQPQQQHHPHQQQQQHHHHHHPNPASVPLPPPASSHQPHQQQQQQQHPHHQHHHQQQQHLRQAATHAWEGHRDK